MYLKDFKIACLCLQVIIFIKKNRELAQKMAEKKKQKKKQKQNKKKQKICLQDFKIKCYLMRMTILKL